jgi:serine/threonine-protein kinase HipA
LTALRHQSGNVESFFRGLLPENPELLAGLALDAGTSTRDVLGLLAHVGDDLPGAVRVRHQVNPPPAEGGVEWISLDEIASRLASLTNSQSRASRDYPQGRWSLAGAQAKLALRFEDGRWGIPWGIEPTTHILKPAIPGFGNFDLHEAVVTPSSPNVTTEIAMRPGASFASIRKTCARRLACPPGRSTSRRAARG